MLSSTNFTWSIIQYFDPFISQLTTTNHPVDTGRKLNVHKTFRRRPGRLLNVLCTFNLRRVYWGIVRFLYILKTFPGGRGEKKEH